MSAPADLSRLRINRDAPPPTVRKALGRNLIIIGAALIVLVAAAFTVKSRSVPTVQVVTAAAGTGGAPAGGATSGTANGYVVARTKASVSAKTAGGLAFLGGGAGSDLTRGSLVARPGNAGPQP